MTCHSATCVLLRWTPPQDLPPDMHVQRLGYRVYVDGTPEGMVRDTGSWDQILGLYGWDIRSIWVGYRVYMGGIYCLYGWDTGTI